MANVGKRLANTTYNWANDQGNPLLDEEDQRYQDQAGTGNFEGGEAANAYENDLQNGYDYGESSGVLGLRTADQGGSNVPGLEQLSSVSPDEANANFLTGDEQTAIQGDPRAAADTESAALDSATGARYGGGLQSQVAGTGTKLDSITSNPNLSLDPNFESNYDMSPAEQQDIVNSAARNVSQVSQGNEEAAVRANNAAGIGPLGMAAVNARMSRAASSDSAAAATNARIAASQEAASRLQTAQGMKLGAAQTQASDKAAATEYTGSQGVSTAEDTAAKQMQAAQDTEASEAAAEKEASDRATTLGTNRQTTQETNSGNNYTRGMAANTALSSRYGQVGNTRLAQQNTGAAGLTNQQQIDSSNANTALSDKNSTIGTVGQVENGASGVVTGAQAQPTTTDKIIGAGLGALSAFEDGGIVDEPTLANLGEDGPEAVVPLSPTSQPGGSPVDIGSFRKNMQMVGNVAGGIRSGMNGQPFQSRYGQPPANGGTPPFQQPPQTQDPNAPPVSGWRSALTKVGNIAGGARSGMAGPLPPRPPALNAPPQAQPTSTPFDGQPMATGRIVNRPTRAIIGEDGPEAVVPLRPKNGSRMRPSAVFGKRYGAA